jgi:molybdopterin synthase sulfur carrier subunit
VSGVLTVLNVVFFASLRERFQSAGFAVEIGQIETVAGLIEGLTLSDGTPFGSIFTEEKLMVAVNQEVVDVNGAIAEGDEVAFFPPVTGG